MAINFLKKISKHEQAYRDNKVVFYLTLPIVVLYVFIIFLVVWINPGQNLTAYLAAVAIATVIIVLMETHIFRTRIATELMEKERIEKLLQEQEKSARLLIRRDLELTRANEKLRELDERKSEFVSVVAHQLRTPLSGIKWTLNMLLSGELGSVTNEQRSFILKGYESNERMIALIEDMLGADRIESGKFHYEFRAASIGDMIDTVVYEMLPVANRRDVKMEFSNKYADMPKVLIDLEKMRQVIQNLIDNAIKYTTKGGKIRISLEKDGDFVRVAVSDNGIGIPKDQQKNIFGRFYRATNAFKVATSGSGLGLFIVKSIVEKHGGKIWFESSEGVGTTFFFTLKVV